MPRLFEIAMLASALAALVLVQRRRGPGPGVLPVVTIRDVPAVLTALSLKTRDGTFAVFLFGANGEPPAAEGALNVQFSVEGGEMGIDWVLISPLNVDAQERFRSFFNQKACAVFQREMNDVKYLRVQTGHLSQLLQEFLRQEFGVTSGQAMSLIASGFKWERAG